MTFSSVFTLCFAGCVQRARSTKKLATKCPLPQVFLHHPKKMAPRMGTRHIFRKREPRKNRDRELVRTSVGSEVVANVAVCGSSCCNRVQLSVRQANRKWALVLEPEIWRVAECWGYGRIFPEGAFGARQAHTLDSVAQLSSRVQNGQFHVRGADVVRR